MNVSVKLKRVDLVQKKKTLSNKNHTKQFTQTRSKFHLGALFVLKIGKFLERATLRCVVGWVETGTTTSLRGLK